MFHPELNIEFPPITHRQAQVLRALHTFVAEHGFSPSYTHLAPVLGLKSRGNLTRFVRILCELGYAQQTPRGVVITPLGIQFLQAYPLAGRDEHEALTVGQAAATSSERARP